MLEGPHLRFELLGLVLREQFKLDPLPNKARKPLSLVPSWQLLLEDSTLLALPAFNLAHFGLEHCNGLVSAFGGTIDVLKIGLAAGVAVLGLVVRYRVVRALVFDCAADAVALRGELVAAHHWVCVENRVADGSHQPAKVLLNRNDEKCLFLYEY